MQGIILNIPARAYLALLLLLFAVVNPNMSFAIPYSFSGSATHVASGDSVGVSGSLNIQDTPSVDIWTYDSSYQPVYDFRYAMDFVFYLGADTYQGSGTMLIRGAAGLFDAQFGYLNSALNQNGDTYHWTAHDADFYYPDGTAYPEWYADSLAYALLPERIDFSGGSTYISPQPFSSWPNINYTFSTLSATSVPEPASILLMSIFLFSLITIRKYAERHGSACVR